MSIFEYSDYKKYINTWIERLPKGGYGEYRKIALHLGVSSTIISQIFRGDKHLSLEMAVDLAEYLELSEEESDYFVLMIEFSRAGSFKLGKKFERQIKQRQDHFKKLENRVKKSVTLSEETKAIYYSSYLYSAVRLLTDIDQYSDSESLSQHLNVPRNQVQKIIDFLLQNELLLKKSGKLKLGPSRIFIGSSHHLVPRHHQNWRVHGFQKMIQSHDENFFYTAPMVLSESVAEKIRRELPAFIEKIVKEVQDSPSEVGRCLNIDWFDI